VQLESRLERTTLGDVLGTMYREKFTGCLTLTDLRFQSHKIHLRAGRPSAVESPLGAPKLGEVLLQARPNDFTRRAIERSLLSPRGKQLGQNLLAEGCINQNELVSALLEQTRLRLQRLFALRGASIRANLGVSPLNSDTPALSPDVYLWDCPRTEAAARTSHSGVPNPERRTAHSTTEVRSAFRAIAARLHPDRATALSDRVLRTQKLAELTAAYHLLL
jgi:hypothetical protein